MPQASDARNPKILFVDDEPQALKYFEKGLSDDFGIITAQSADEAERLVGQHGDEIGVVISDQRMPGRSGASLLGALRQSHPQIVRVLTTAYSDIDNAIEAVNRGEIFRYIVKPWDFESLRQELRVALYVHSLQRERSLLVAEKLSVRQRLRAADRARNLLVAASALPALARASEAICAYVSDAAATGQGLSVVPNVDLDLWSEAEAETEYMTEVAATLAALPAVAGNGAQNESVLADAWRQTAFREDVMHVAPQAARAQPVHMTIRIHTPYLVQLLSCFLKGSADWLPGGDLAVSIEADSMLGQNGGFRVTVSGAAQKRTQDALLFESGEGRDVGRRTNLLAAYLLAGELGGKVFREVSGDMGIATLELPHKPRLALVATSEPALSRQLFRSLELWF